MSASNAGGEQHSARSLSSGAATTHTCRICQRTFERAAHLKRHLQSHENTRSYRCAQCSKGFNRADLLSRHAQSHNRRVNSDDDRLPIRRTERATQACVACASSKTKCDDGRPCKRCKIKNIPCVLPDADGSSRASISATNGQLFDTTSPQTSYMSRHQPAVDYRKDRGAETENRAFPVESPSNQLMPDFSHSPLRLDSTSMAPGSLLNREAGIDMGMITSTRQEVQYGLTPNFGGAGHDLDDMFLSAYGSGFSQDMDFGLWDFNFDELQFNGTSMAEPAQAEDSYAPTAPDSNVPERDVSRGYAAFKRSPWLWTPAAIDHVHKDHANLMVDRDHFESSIASLSSTTPRSALESATSYIDSSLRDRIFALVLTTVKPSKITPAFPSLDLLDYILQNFFIRDEQVLDSFIHKPTFSAHDARIELVISIISAGAMSVSVPDVWKMGLALQDIVRVTVAALVSKSWMSTSQILG